MDASHVRAKPQAQRPVGERAHRVAAIFFIAVALFIAGAGVVLVPLSREAGKAVEIERLQTIAQDNRRLCEKWGMKEHTPEHVSCTVDLNELRARQDRDTAERLMGVF